jgi:hypothetical protein
MSEQATIRAIDQRPVSLRPGSIPGVPEGYRIKKIDHVDHNEEYLDSRGTLQRWPYEQAPSPYVHVILERIEQPKSRQIVIVADISEDGWYMPWVDDALKEGLRPETAERLQKQYPERISIRDTPSTPRIVLTLPLTPESQQIVDHPKLFWITSQHGTAFSKFAVGVREVA